jgi:hypothetical protein
MLTFPAVYCYVNMNDTDGNTCVIYLCHGIFFILARSIQNSGFAKNASVYSGADYTFPVLLIKSSQAIICVIWLKVTDVSGTISVPIIRAMM